MASPEKSSGILAFFQLSDRNSCELAIKAGGILAMVAAGINAVFAIAGFFWQSDDTRLAFLMDPWALVDTALSVTLGLFIFKKSRIAACLMLLYFIASKIYIWMELGKPTGLFFTAIFVAIYFNAARAAVVWHRTFKNSSLNGTVHSS